MLCSRRMMLNIMILNQKTIQKWALCICISYQQSFLMSLTSTIKPKNKTEIKANTENAKDNKIY